MIKAPAPPAPVTPASRPTECGDLGIRIDRNGTWFYHGSPIHRKEMVCLFASVLSRCAEGHYWLTTPAERGRIEVEDAPFLAVELYNASAGRERVVSFRTNVDEMVTLDAQHPLRFGICPIKGERIPYILVRDGLEARLARPVYYELVNLGIEETIEGETTFGIWSSGQFFPIGPVTEAD
ncbi:MAG: DUF1285 domain-containing protein [Rhodospirillales bacterium]|nr:DUF1285 domain-containing protein [Rhodospirillales bacterium]